MIIHYEIKVEGKVQGVFYRVSTKKKAKELGINGIVKNHNDGSVYIEAEGKKEVLDELVEWCKKGPLLAKVTAVQVGEKKLKNYTGFEINYF